MRMDYKKLSICELEAMSIQGLSYREKFDEDVYKKDLK
jgi:hypothetical protein